MVWDEDAHRVRKPPSSTPFFLLEDVFLLLPLLLLLLLFTSKPLATSRLPPPTLPSRGGNIEPLSMKQEKEHGTSVPRFMAHIRIFVTIRNIPFAT